MELVRSSISIVSGLPRDKGGSAPATTFSRPAQRSLTLRPTCSRSRFNDPFHRQLQQLRCLHNCVDCYRVERTSSRTGFAPAEVQRLFTAHFIDSNHYRVERSLTCTYTRVCSSCLSTVQIQCVFLKCMGRWREVSLGSFGRLETTMLRLLSITAVAVEKLCFPENGLQMLFSCLQMSDFLTINPLP